MFEGSLSDHPNKMTTPVAEQIEWGDSKAALPGGQPTFDRIVQSSELTFVRLERLSIEKQAKSEDVKVIEEP